MKIENVRRFGDYGWVWDVVFEEGDLEYRDDCDPDEFPNSIHYATNADGEGLWREKRAGYDLQFDTIATDMGQIKGTAQYSMRGCDTVSSARSHIRRWLKRIYRI